MRKNVSHSWSKWSVVKEEKHGLIFGKRKGTTVAVGIEQQEWKVVSNHYSYFQSNPNRKLMQLFNVGDRMVSYLPEECKWVLGMMYSYDLSPRKHCTLWSVADVLWSRSGHCYSKHTQLLFTATVSKCNLIYYMDHICYIQYMCCRWFIYFDLVMTLITLRDEYGIISLTAHISSVCEIILLSRL